MPRMVIRLVTLVAAAAVAVVSGPASASAHTEPGFVAVPAGEPASVVLKPTHGCDESPTVSVSTRVAVEGATAGEVPGWTSTAEADGEGNTVLEWRGGSLPSDEVGQFPVNFDAPDAVGELLLFPFIQICDNGEELAWISGDPAADFPAPRVLILPPGSEPAPTIDDVPVDAPGREQLTQVVDVDDGEEPIPTTTSSTVGTTETTETIAPPSAEPVATSSDDEPPWTLIVLGGLAVLAVAGFAVRKLRAS